MRDPFHQLMQEHRVIELVLDAFEMGAGLALPPAFYERASEFVANYADAFHHAKEEERLFTFLEERGMARDYGPLGVMLHEHDTGRKHVAAMREQIRAGDLDAVRSESLAFAALLREHIAKEDEVLFPMGRAMLTPEEIAEVQASFDHVDEPPPSREAWERVASELLDEVRQKTVGGRTPG